MFHWMWFIIIFFVLAALVFGYEALGHWKMRRQLKQGLYARVATSSRWSWFDDITYVGPFTTKEELMDWYNSISTWVGIEKVKVVRV